MITITSRIFFHHPLVNLANLLIDKELYFYLFLISPPLKAVWDFLLPGLLPGSDQVVPEGLPSDFRF